MTLRANARPRRRKKNAAFSPIHKLIWRKRSVIANFKTKKATEDYL